MNNDDSIFPAWLTKASIVFFIVFIAVMSYFFIRSQRSKFTSRLAVGTPVLSFGTNPASPKAGENFELLIQVDPKNNDFHAFDLVISYDDTLVEPQNLADLTENITSSQEILKDTNPNLTNIDPAAKTIRIVGARLKEPFSSLSVIARVTVRVKPTVPAGSYEIFKWDEKTKLGDYVKIGIVEKRKKFFKIIEAGMINLFKRFGTL